MAPPCPQILGQRVCPIGLAEAPPVSPEGTQTHATLSPFLRACPSPQECHPTSPHCQPLQGTRSPQGPVRPHFTGWKTGSQRTEVPRPKGPIPGSKGQPGSRVCDRATLTHSRPLTHTHTHVRSHSTSCTSTGRYRRDSLGERGSTKSKDPPPSRNAWETQTTRVWLWLL